MAYRYGDRKQIEMFPQSIEEYVNEDAPVRAYDAIIDGLDLKELGIILDKNKVGNSTYDPVTMLKLLTYSYSYGIKSSRKIERACYDNLSFIWLMGGLKPDHKTICEFRRKNTEVLKNVLKDTVRVCIKLDLVDGNVLFVDGSKFRASAGLKNNHSKAWIEKKLAELDHRINELLTECEKQDQQEAGEDSYVKMNKELSQKKKLRTKIKFALSELTEKKLEKVNITDPDSGVMKGRQGSHNGFNVQSVVDQKEGIIVHTEPVTDKNDQKQFETQIQKGISNVGKKCKVACGDAGYANTDVLEEIDNEEIHVIVPTSRQVSKKEAGPFGKIRFQYDKQENCYYCPEGHKLRYCGVNRKRKLNNYIIEDKKRCGSCKHFGECTKSSRGRKIERYWNEELTERFEQQYTEAKDTYKQRMHKVESPFGHIKSNLGYGQFLLRGLNKVQGEISLLASCYNISRMIGKFGVEGLIERIKKIESPQYA